MLPMRDGRTNEQGKIRATQPMDAGWLSFAIQTFCVQADETSHELSGLREEFHKLQKQYQTMLTVRSKNIYLYDECIEIICVGGIAERISKDN